VGACCCGRSGRGSSGLGENLFVALGTEFVADVGVPRVEERLVTLLISLHAAGQQGRQAKARQGKAKQSSEQGQKLGISDKRQRQRKGQVLFVDTQIKQESQQKKTPTNKNTHYYYNT
jgi:hypothetical protein